MPANPNATEQEIMEFAGRLMDEFRISGEPLVNYDR